MNRFINKILREDKNEMNDDPFFQPKDIENREEEEKQKREEFLSKIKLGLRNIKKDYENKNWNSESEKSFLKIFSKLHLNETYDKKWDVCLLKDKNDTHGCIFDLKNDIIWVSYEGIWSIFSKEFRWTYHEIQQFMVKMLKKHFKLYEFIPQGGDTVRFELMKKHFKLYE